VDATQFVHDDDHALLLIDPALQQTHKFSFVFVLYAVDADAFDFHAAQF